MSTQPTCSQHGVPLTAIYDNNGYFIRYRCYACDWKPAEEPKP